MRVRDEYTLSADAADRRAALEAATYLVGQPQPGWSPGEWHDHRDRWLDHADAAYQWLRQRATLHAIAITFNPLFLRREVETVNAGATWT